MEDSLLEHYGIATIHGLHVHNILGFFESFIELADESSNLLYVAMIPRGDN